MSLSALCIYIQGTCDFLSTEPSEFFLPKRINESTTLSTPELLIEWRWAQELQEFGLTVPRNGLSFRAKGFFLVQNTKTLFKYLDASNMWHWHCGSDFWSLIAVWEPKLFLNKGRYQLFKKRITPLHEVPLKK